jgi:hypothetical protein
VNERRAQDLVQCQFLFSETQRIKKGNKKKEAKKEKKKERSKKGKRKIPATESVARTLLNPSLAPALQHVDTD